MPLNRCFEPRSIWTPSQEKVSGWGRKQGEIKLLVFKSVDRILTFSEQRQLAEILSNGIEIVTRSIQQGASVPIASRADVKIIELSERHRQILYLLRNGKTNPEISAILQLSRKNVKYHIERIFDKLDVSNRTQAVAKAIDLNIPLLPSSPL